MNHLKKNRKIPKEKQKALFKKKLNDQIKKRVKKKKKK